MTSIAVVVVVVTTTITLVAAWLWLHRERQRKSRDPKTWPVVGAQIEIVRNLKRIHDWVLGHFSDDHRTIKLSTFSTTSYLTVDPNNVEYILKTNFQNFPKGKAMHIILYDFLGDGIFNTDGEMWKRHRKVASLEFSNRKLRDFSTDIFREDALGLVELLKTATDMPQAVDLQDLFLRMTLSSICKIGFGVSMYSLSQDTAFGKAFDIVNELILHRFRNPLWRIQKAMNIGNEKILNQNMHILDAFTADVINKRKAEIQSGNKNKTRADLLSRFLSLNQGQPEAYNDKDLRDSILNFVIAGRDTTAITLSWFIYCMCNNPEAAETIFEETQMVLGLDSKKKYSFKEIAEKIDYGTLGKMHYLHAAITETLRLYPAVPRDTKYAAADDVLPDGTHVKQGNRVAYVPYSMGRMEFLWGEDVLKFKPDRWLKDGVFQPESPFKFATFQAGPRICLGKDSAYLQMKVTASLLLQFFRFQLVKGHVVEYRITLVMPMANGLLVHVSSR